MGNGISGQLREYFGGSLDDGIHETFHLFLRPHLESANAYGFAGGAGEATAPLVLVACCCGGGGGGGGLRSADTDRKRYCEKAGTGGSGQV